MTTTTLDYKNGTITNPHHTAEGDTFTNIYSLNYDFLFRKLHDKITPTVFFPDIEPTNIIEFETINDGHTYTHKAIVLSVNDDSITISYATTAEVIILKQ